MTIFTRYGSQVQITTAYKQFADVGVLLVQAQVGQVGNHAPASLEANDALVNQHDPFSRGWVPSTQLISDRGQQEIITACMNAPDGTPSNVTSLLRFYWPQVFGPLQTEDMAVKTTIMSGLARRIGSVGG